MNIYKYPLRFTVIQTIKARFVKPLCVQTQVDTPCLWAMVDENIPEKELTVFMVGTGTHDVDNIKVQPEEYIATTQHGGYVFHWFVRE